MSAAPDVVEIVILENGNKEISVSGVRDTEDAAIAAAHGVLKDYAEQYNIQVMEEAEAVQGDGHFAFRVKFRTSQGTVMLPSPETHGPRWAQKHFN